MNAKLPPCVRSWCHSLASAGFFVYAREALSDIALLLAVLSTLASLTLTLLTIRKMLRAEKSTATKGDGR